MDSPNYVTGAFNYYFADRDPTSNEPDILAGLLVPSVILTWKNTVTGAVWILKNATSDTPPVLTWQDISFSSAINR